MLNDFDVEALWEKSEYADDAYVDEPLTDAVVAQVERTLGYKLPTAYVAMMKLQNGGIPRTCHRAQHRRHGPTTTWLFPAFRASVAGSATPCAATQAASSGSG